MIIKQIKCSCFAFCTFLMTIPYILMCFGILPKLELINTITGLIIVLSLFIYHWIRYGLNPKAIIFSKYIIFIIWVIYINLLGIYGLQEVDRFIYNANALSVVVLSYFLFIENKILLNLDSIKSILCIVVLFAMLSSITNIVLNFDSIVHVSGLIRAYDANFSGLFIGKNQFGGFLFLSIVSCFFLRGIYKINISIYTILFLIFNLIITFSRSPIIATIIFLLISKMRIKKTRNIAIGIAICMIIIAIYNFTPLNDIADRFLIRSEVGSAGRLERWDRLIEIMIHNPMILLGISSAGFKELLLYSGFGFAQIDNAYLEILGSYGFIGMLIYIFLFANNIIILKKINNTNCNIKNMLLGFTVSFAFYNLLESVILFEAGLTQWVATILFIAIPRYGMKEIYMK